VGSRVGRPAPSVTYHRSVTGILHVVGTPIGNLADITERARATLAEVDLIAAEDTRRTGLLLQHLGLVKRPMVSLHDANEAQRAGDVLAALRDGRSVALVSDGGMPLVSDPGFRLVRAASEAGIEVRVVPGPSAAVAALVVSGLPTDRWAFEGFLPKKEGERRTRLEAVRDDRRTLVFFESPHRVRAFLDAVRSVLGDRRIAVCRELTKLHEEVLRGTVGEVLESLGDLRGEVVVVVAGAERATGDAAAAAEQARTLVREGMRTREAARVAGRRHGVPANDVYASLVDEGGDRR
jgi:16S rRNA (cytidine1402-2'-O)-methyltransferase